MPYIATDLDAFDDADAVAGSTGLSPPLVLGGLARTWRWCWRNKTDRVTAEQLAGFFCSPAPGLPAALVAFGFLEALETYRVRGVDRYLRLSEVRAAAGKARAEKAKRDAATGQLLPSTQPAHAGQSASMPPAADQPFQRRSKVEGRSTEEEDLPRAPPAGPAPLVLEEQRQTRTRKPSRQQVLYSALVAHRAEVLGPDALPDEHWTIQRQNEVLGGPILECEPGLLLAALRRFLESEFAGRCNPPGPLGVFVKQWSRWVSDAMRSNQVGAQ